MSYIIQPKVTPSRLAWLQALAEKEQPLPKTRGNRGFFCMSAGWTEWIDINVNSNVRLTDAGRAILSKHSKAP